MDNYRPISLLVSFSKIFEKVAFKQLYTYFKENNLFFYSQYGFLPDHSTELACMELVDKIYKDLDQKRMPLSIFMDLSKAFDTLDHTILKEKLKYYGVTGTALKWFSSYLENRMQYVEINNIRSNTQTIKTGVPQGSILGPLLFLIYMNDIHKSSNLFSFVVYADGTTLYTYLNFSNACMSTQDTSNMITCELDCVYEWLCVNKLSLNVNKTKYMVYSFPGKKTPTLDIRISDCNISQVNDFNFLGIHIDSNLSWNSHISYISCKIARNCGILNRIKRFLTSQILRTLYFSMINSFLLYGILVWGFNNERLFK